MLPRGYDFPEELFVPDFLPYLEAPQAVQLFTGNRGSSKSTFNYQRAIIFALSKKYFRLIYCRKVADTIRSSSFQSFKDLIFEYGLQNEFVINVTEMNFTAKRTGNKLFSFGLDKPEKLKGFSDPTHVLWDEMTEGTFADYAALTAILRTTKVKKTQFWGAFNPEYDFWGRDYFFLHAENDEIPLGEVPAKTEDTLILKTTFERNPFIDKVAYRKKLIELANGDENYLTVWLEGNWGQPVTGNEYYTQFKKTQHVGSVPYLPNKPVHLTYDFNVHPYMTQLCYQVNVTDTEFQIRLFKEYCLASPMNNTEACGKAFLRDYKVQDLFYYGDASGNNGIAGKGNVSAFDDVRKTLRRYLTEASKRVLKQNPPVLKRRDFINNLLAGKITYNGLKVTLLIDESAKETINDFSKLKLGADGKMKERVKDKVTGITYEKRGHPTDASEYFIIRLLWDEFKKRESN